MERIRYRVRAKLDAEATADRFLKGMREEHGREPFPPERATFERNEMPLVAEGNSNYSG